MSKRFDVVGLGQCSYDIIGRLADFPEPDQKTELDELICQGGGPVATALVALSRLGVSVSFCGRVGDDDFGKQIQAGLLADNVDCQSLLTDTNATSQTAFIAVGQEGQRNIFWNRGSARPLRPVELDIELVANARILHLDGSQNETSIHAVQIARDNGVLIVLDGGSVREGTMELLPFIDHLVVSEVFAEQICPGASIEEKLSSLLSLCPGVVTITCGPRGSWTKSVSIDLFHQSAFPVDAIDTTGCGDVFHGGYIYGLLQGWELRDTVRFAAACAALKTRQLGGRTAIPSLDEVYNFLNINKINNINYKKVKV